MSEFGVCAVEGETESDVGSSECKPGVITEMVLGGKKSKVGAGVELDIPVGGSASDEGL